MKLDNNMVAGMGKTIKFLILFLLLIILSEPVHAATSVLISGTEIRATDSDSWSMTKLKEMMDAKYPGQTDIFNDGTIWYLNKTIRLYNTGGGARFFINNSDVSEVRINGSLPGTDIYGGSWYIENVTIGSWDFGKNSYSTDNGTAQLEASCPVLRNVNFSYFGKVYVPYAESLEYYNITHMHGSGSAIQLARFNNSTIHDVYIEDYGVCGFNIQKSFNSELYNISVINDGCLQEATGHYGIVVTYDGSTWTRCENITVHDCYVRHVGYSGINTNSYWTTFYNITVIEAGHNGCDIHGGHNTTAYNISIYNTTGNNFYSIGRDGNYTDITSYNPGGEHFNVYRDNCTFTNIKMEGGTRGVAMFGSNNTRFINVTKLNSTGSPMSLSQVSTYTAPINTTFTDAYIPYGTVYMHGCFDTKLINNKYNSIYNGITPSHEYGIYYYADFLTVNSSGIPVAADINLTNNVNSSRPCMDGFANPKSIFNTGDDGRTDLPSVSRGNTPVISERYKVTGKSTEIHSHTANVSTVLGNISLDGILPDSRWYRFNNSQSNYTITVILNTSENLHITGYAPTPTYNTYQPNDIIKFQVWANEPLSNIVWKKDGAEVQNGTSTTYETTISTAPITVGITGTGNTETVSKTWTIDPSQVVEPVPDPDPENNPTPYPPVTNFTSNTTNGTIPKKIQFNDSSVNATNWYWDFDNNGKIDSTVRNATFTYRTAGNYTVKLTTSNSEGSNSTIKTEYISVEKQSWSVIIWNFFFGLAGRVTHV